VANFRFTLLAARPINDRAAPGTPPPRVPIPEP
jgi:hypothetical protein